MNMNFRHALLSLVLPVVMACSESAPGGNSPGDGVGQGGSMARFAVRGDFLYAVDHSTLKTFDISSTDKPAYLAGKDQYLDFGVETIFPLDTLLFLGSQTGLYVYDITRPGFPQQRAHVSHVTSCDPVVAAGQYAYVTLNSASVFCGRAGNELQVYDLSNIDRPTLVHTISGLRGPRGLGVYGRRLFVCDNGLKVYDISQPDKPVWVDDLTHLPEISGIDTYDVIPLEGGILLLIGADGFYQFDVAGEKLSLKSKIPVSPN
jgi:hypothetical protein